MAVYFVYRCGYLGPTCLHRRVFPDATVLDWFRRVWPVGDIDDAEALCKQLLGTHVAYFDAMLANIAEEATPKPRTPQDVADAIQGGYNNAVCFEEHCIQVLTDDDETDMAYYFFDDVFLAQHADLAAYLLRDDWRLPDGEGEGWRPKVRTSPAVKRRQGKGPGRLYTACIDQHSGEYLGDGFAAQHILGLRVGDLSRWLMGLDEETAEDVGWLFPSLRQLLLTEELAEGEERAFLQALRQDPRDDLTWSVYADWAQEHGGRAPGLRLLERALPRVAITPASDPSRNLAQVGDHVLQLFAHDGDDDFDQWFIFDDLWGGAQPVLANALLRYTRWDVLSTGNETRWE